VAATIAHAQPFFWRASIARALVAAVQTLPDYTFTAESFPCPKGFVWFEEPIQLEPDSPHHAPLRALAWSVVSQRQDPDGVPVLIYAFVSAEPRRAGVPAINGTIRLGWTLGENLKRRADQMLAAPSGPPSCTSRDSRTGRAANAGQSAMNRHLPPWRSGWVSTRRSTAFWPAA
jgi:hypothetical protein